MSFPEAAYPQPISEGWGSVIGALHSMRTFTVPMALAVNSPDFGTMWVDFVRERYYLDRPLAALPVRPTGVTLYSQQQQPGQELFPWVTWQPLDQLLWHLSSFGRDETTPALRRAGDRYLLTRWPDLTRLSHSPSDIRVLAALGGGQPLTAAEAAVLADASELDVEKLLDTLVLAGCVDAVMGAPVPPAVMERAAERAHVPARRKGLFGRLRRRLEVDARG